MTLEINISALSVAEIEEWVDKEFEKNDLPHAIKDVAIWHVLTVCEDWVRMLFTGIIKLSEQGVEYDVDQLKYAIKVSLGRIHRESKIDTSFPTPEKTIPDSYRAAQKLIFAGLEYSNMIRIFSLIHRKHSEMIISNTNLEIIYSKGYDARYSALEVLNHGKAPAYDISTFVFNIMSGRERDDDLEALLTSGTRIRNRRVVYKYLLEGVSRILNKATQRDLIISNEFVFEWGSGHETHALINSLLIRCVYHLLSINFAAKKFNISGGFDSSLLLKITRKKLIEDINLLANFPEEKIGKFIDVLTYGTNSKTPDPALQPIFTMKNGDILIPCAHTITNNLQRNILTLIARTQPSTFDSQSKIFEIRMCNELLSASKRWERKGTNKIFKIGGAKEEIDLFILDEITRTILVLEARWMLQPGDPIEVINRIDACSKKVSQISRKASFMRKYIHQILENSFKISSIENDWQVLGAVVIEGFSGKLSEDPELPIITIDVLKVGLNVFSDLTLLHDWIKSLEWLPQPGVHFIDQTNKIDTIFGTIQQPSILILSDPQKYLNHVQLSANKGSLSPD